MSNKLCRKCGNALTNENWLRSCQASYDYLCRECKNSSRRKTGKRVKTKPEPNVNFSEQDIIKQTLYNEAKRRAKERNLEFDIQISDIIVPEYCPVFGVKLERNVRGKNQTSPSLDRLDSSKGYTKDNIKVISSRANTLKNNGTIEEFEKLLSWLKNQ